MNWSTVGEAVKEYAPLVGMALTSPVGAVAAVGKVVANIFGTKADPEEVMRFIDNDPQKAAERLQYELANNLDFQKLCLQKVQEDNRHEEQMASLQVSENKSARENSVNVNKSPEDNFIKNLLTISIIFIFSGLMIAYFFFHKEFDQGATMFLGTVIGALLNSINTQFGFYWGNSIGSKNKDFLIMSKK